MLLPFLLVRDVRCAVSLVTALLILTGIGSGQSSDTPSLGDLARTQRQKRQQQAKGSPDKPKKIVTNEDIPEHPETSGESPESRAVAAGEESLVPPAGDVAKTGDQWKAAIQQQKSRIAELKVHLDRLRSSIHFVVAKAYYNGVEYNKIQARKQQEVGRLETQLSDMQKNLEHMQEAARKAGFASAVWDP